MKIRISSNYVSKDKKTIFQSFLSLGAIQATNYLLPLITIPYIIRVIGTDKFGTVALAQAVLGFLSIIVDYGFSLSATRDISIYREDKNKLSKIFSEVIIVKLLLCLFCFIILYLISFIFSKIGQEVLLYFMGFSLVIGQSIIPVWFFQGIEKMKYLTYLNLTSKAIGTILIFILITSPADYIYIILLSSLGNIISGIIGLWIIFNKFSIKLWLPSTSNIIIQLKDGWPIFLSNFSIASYNNSNILILGMFASNTIVGYYSIVEKVILVMRQLLGSFSSAIFPHICKISIISYDEIKSFLKIIFIPFSIIIFIVCSCIFVFSSYIIFFLSGKYINEASFLLKILSFVPFIIVLNNPPYQVLVAYNKKKSYSIILLSGAIVNLFLNVILVKDLQALGTAIAIICTEIFITAGLFIILEIKHPLYSLLSINTKSKKLHNY